MAFKGEQATGNLEYKKFDRNEYNLENGCFTDSSGEVLYFIDDSGKVTTPTGETVKDESGKDLVISNDSDIINLLYIPSDVVYDYKTEVTLPLYFNKNDDGIYVYQSNVELFRVGNEYVNSLGKNNKFEYNVEIIDSNKKIWNTPKFVYEFDKNIDYFNIECITDNDYSNNIGKLIFLYTVRFRAKKISSKYEINVNVVDDYKYNVIKKLKIILKTRELSGSIDDEEELISNTANIISFYNNYDIATPVYYMCSNDEYSKFVISEVKLRLYNSGSSSNILSNEVVYAIDTHDRKHVEGSTENKWFLSKGDILEYIKSSSYKRLVFTECKINSKYLIGDSGYIILNDTSYKVEVKDIFYTKRKSLDKFEVTESITYNVEYSVGDVKRTKEVSSEEIYSSVDEIEDYFDDTIKYIGCDICEV